MGEGGRNRRIAEGREMKEVMRWWRMERSRQEEVREKGVGDSYLRKRYG